MLVLKLIFQLHGPNFYFYEATQLLHLQEIQKMCNTCKSYIQRLLPNFIVRWIFKQNQKSQNYKYMLTHYPIHTHIYSFIHFPIKTQIPSILKKSIIGRFHSNGNRPMLTHFNAIQFQHQNLALFRHLSTLGYIPLKRASFHYGKTQVRLWCCYIKMLRNLPRKRQDQWIFFSISYGRALSVAV